MQKANIDDIIKLLESEEIPKEGMTREFEVLLNKDLTTFVELSSDTGKSSGLKLSEIYSKIDLKGKGNEQREDQQKYIDIVNNLNYMVTKLVNKYAG